MKQAGVPAPDTPGPAPPRRLSPPPSMKQAGVPAPGMPGPAPPRLSATILSQGPLPPIVEEEAGEVAAAEGSDTEPSEESETVSIDWSEDGEAGKDDAAWPDEEIDEE